MVRNEEILSTSIILDKSRIFTMFEDTMNHQYVVQRMCQMLPIMEQPKFEYGEGEKPKIEEQLTKNTCLKKLYLNF